jgi:hypothetical protein
MTIFVKTYHLATLTLEAAMLDRFSHRTIGYVFKAVMGTSNRGRSTAP